MANQNRQHGSKLPKCIDRYIHVDSFNKETLVVVNKVTNRCHLDHDTSLENSHWLAKLLLEKGGATGIPFKPKNWAVSYRPFF